MNKTIAVIGATGLQGTGVVNALVNDGTFKVRAITRNPDTYQGNAHEVVHGDLNNEVTLKNAFKDAYGVFLVTNFWEGADEIKQGSLAVKAAKEAGVEHVIWSTLPNVEEISNGAFDVPHFTGKAKVDELVSEGGFEYTTFVQAPFYFQNFIGMVSPQPKDDGTTGWTLPLDPNKKVIHMADILDLGKVVAGAFLNPDTYGNGAYLSLATELNSFNDVLTAYANAGKEYTFTQVPDEVFATFFEGAKEFSEMFGYFEAHTYMGPNSEKQISDAQSSATEPLNSLNDWLKQNLS